MSNKLCSIIVRTKNEERWIPHCLKAVFSQTYKNFEVIIVDNESTDNTLEKVSKWNINKVVDCKEYLPGKSLNLGIKEAKGDYLVFLSGHCIPRNEKWLSELIKNFNDEQVAGVYGRQEPLAFTSNSDKRELAVIFGRDKKIQFKDSFFHNANSAIRMNLWREQPFDEKITNIEDRLWAENILKKGYKIIYEPESSVYHYHGIHQDGDETRLANHVRILKILSSGLEDNLHVDTENLNIIAIIPYRGNVIEKGQVALFNHTIEYALKSKLINKVIVSTDNNKTAQHSLKIGAETPFLRKKLLSEDFIDVETVLQYSLEKLEASGIYPDLIVYLEITYPFRDCHLIDNAIEQLISNGHDTVIACKKEYKSILKQVNGKYEIIDKVSTLPRKYGQPIYIELKGLCTVTYPEYIRQGSIHGMGIGLLEVPGELSSIEIRGKEQVGLFDVLKDYNNR